MRPNLTTTAATPGARTKFALTARACHRARPFFPHRFRSRAAQGPPNAADYRPGGRSHMNLFDTTQLGLQSAISGAGMRQATIAGNIANANTPGYQRKDVDFHTTLRNALASDTPMDAVKTAAFSPATDTTGPMRADGNGVDIDIESATMASSALEYETLVAVYTGRTDVMRSAIGV
ncbi:hypothetical protein ABVK25_012135 [Lepraria finkii]|uniref:Flagellar basal body rod protein N-terminal domain-containing protein n=1 Tax=Lepraria finkii TaxID=1340010 RepID=A0ABR4AJW7_9LECA